ncbi:MAG: ECF transporter S component [Muribaculaceae bacterium]|nr:ECF transporter S component [Roseburia sp.]MCM1432226.1 ECF transporter S component [Muribaculaceae bacterium]MCM1491997.1 ECF transporter S component [Muribaculaceae bacterium]
METVETSRTMQTSTKLKRANVVLLTELALLTAIVILMAYTPLGYLRAGAVEITFIVVPVAIGAVLLGVKAGAFLGLVFGLTSFAQCFGMSPMGTLMFSAKPLATAFCCIVPRILVGVVPALVYLGMTKLCKKRVVNIAVSCVLAPITNTVLYLGCMTLFFQDYLMEAYSYTGKGGIVFLGWLFALVAVNAVLEAASCLLLGSAICNALWSTTRKAR